MSRISKFSLIAISAMLMAACSSPTATPSKPAAGAPATNAQRGGTAVLAIDSDPDTLNFGLTTNFSAGDVASKIFQGLVWLDGNWKPQPQLATSWTVSDDAKTYTFKLRDGVKWHDGKPFSSADVVYSLKEVIGKFHPRSKALIDRAESIEAPDASTVIVKLKAPYAPFLIQMTAFDAPILPKHIYEGSDVLKNDANNKPIGTGPFKFSEWNKGQNLKVVRNPDYWEKDKPYLDGIVFQITPQAANRSTGLETGEIDFVADFYLPKADVKRLSASDKLQSKRGQGAPAVDFIFINTASAALKNKEARQALALSIDRKRMVEQAMNAIGRNGQSPWGNGFKWMFDDKSDFDKLYPRDVNKAKSLLEKAGVKDAKLRLIYDSARPQFVAGAQIVKENLKEVGIDVELQAVERAVFQTKVFTDRDYDLAFQSFTSSGDPAIGYHRMYATNTTKTANLNPTGFSNAKVDELLAKASNAVTQDARGAAYKEAAVILADEMPVLVLFDEEGVDFASKKLSGLWSSIETRDQWQNVSLTK